MVDSWDAEVGVGLVAEHGVTAMAGTPLFIDTLLDAAAASGGDISSLRFGITGGAGVPPSLIERADAIGWRVARCYGATEGPSMTAAEADDPLEKRSRRDGRPLPGNRIRIVDEAGAEVAVGEAAKSSRSAPSTSSPTATPSSTSRRSRPTAGCAPATSAASTPMAT